MGRQDRAQKRVERAQAAVRTPTVFDTGRGRVGQLNEAQREIELIRQNDVIIAELQENNRLLRALVGETAASAVPPPPPAAASRARQDP